MIFTDGIHLISDVSLQELHDFALSIGLKKEWFQNHKRHPHYDLTTKRAAKRAIQNGANLIDSKTLVRKICETC